ncbi:MAG: FAD-binding oxidoreductase [Ornithinimicrobium sp.]
MTESRATLTRDQIVAAVTDLLGAGSVETDEQRLREVSVDRFHKYEAVHGIYAGPFPAAIVHPASTDQVAQLLELAQHARVAVVPRTGGTGTEGGLETVVPDSLVIDGSSMAEIIDVDEANMMATAQCGTPLRVLEEHLRARGLTTGHSPQSQPLAQMGGLVATRSIGQFSTLYGGIEDMVMGLEAVLPGGEVVRIKSVPRRAAGPDIRHVLIGNEGALAFITEVTVKVFRWEPGSARYVGLLVPDFGDAIGVLREVIVSGYRPAVARVYSPQDARQHFPDHPQDQNLVVFSAEGPGPIVEATIAAVEQIATTVEHTAVEPERIKTWFESLNWGLEKIEAEKADMLRDRRLGYTTEVSVDWSRTAELYERVMRRITDSFAHAEDLHLLGAHSSHSYQTGTNLYFVYDYTIRCEPEEELETYHQPLNAMIVQEALAVGGSMAHHHGVGKYRTPWIHEEHGSAYTLLRGLKDAFDPTGIMNPGTIYPLDEQPRESGVVR